jgi:hypothetical protein
MDRENQLSKMEAEAYLASRKQDFDNLADKASAMVVLREAGMTVGYKPAFRVLVMGESPEKAVRWQG